MTQVNNSTKRLPTELLGVNSPTSIKECFQFLEELADPQTNAEKYKFYLTKEYFLKNILSLTLDELNIGLNNPYIKKNYNEEYTLRLCIENDVAFPILFDCIIKKSVSNEYVYKYADILSRHGKAEELNTIYDYYQFTDNPIVKLFQNTSKPTDTLIEVMIRNDAEYILKTKSWSDEKVISWLKENPEKTIEIIGKTNGSTLGQLPTDVQHVLYDSLIQNFDNLKKEHKNDKEKLTKVINYERNCLVSYPITYIHYLQKNQANYLNNKLKRRMQVTKDNNQYLMNICQYILLERKHSTLVEVEKTFNSYTDLIQSKIIEKIGLFTHEVSPYEYGLKNSVPAFFFPFDINQNMEPKDKEMFLSASFGYLLNHMNAKERNKSHLWYFDIYPKVITTCSDQEFHKYYDMLKSVSVPVLKELDNFMLIREISNSPNNNNKQEKKLKI